ncbi:unnamed protein product [Lactuca virosa]|uniref:Knottin scorpion toxin-like domain-containing protein n=1 Tax=Lactuca virosa TaxID=75947 RepID=A0AAU9P615_9ASTR|nr:unnamed protein product [Lactuca virosa]
MKNISLVVAVFVLMSFLAIGCNAELCYKDKKIIPGFCTDSKCYNTCKSSFGIGASGHCKNFFTCRCVMQCDN